MITRIKNSPEFKSEALYLEEKLGVAELSKAAFFKLIPNLRVAEELEEIYQYESARASRRGCQDQKAVG